MSHSLKTPLKQQKQLRGIRMCFKYYGNYLAFYAMQQFQTPDHRNIYSNNLLSGSGRAQQQETIMTFTMQLQYILLRRESGTFCTRLHRKWPYFTTCPQTASQTTHTSLLLYYKEGENLFISCCHYLTPWWISCTEFLPMQQSFCDGFALQVLACQPHEFLNRRLNQPEHWSTQLTGSHLLYVNDSTPLPMEKELKLEAPL